jgi:DNA gyrase/topoisomerase IV subunit B
MKTGYNAANIERHSCLDPVKRRPGRCTDNARPNQMPGELASNPMEKALGGHAATGAVNSRSRFGYHHSTCARLAPSRAATDSASP